MADVVLGIDPGTALMGWGLVEVATDDSLSVIGYGAISTPSKMPQPRRLQMIYQQLTELFQKYQPGQMAVEELFFNKNTTTAIAVGQARGVALLAAANFDLDVAEYTPLQVKQSLVGYGRATKDQVQQMVQVSLYLDHLPKPDDAADALAIAICHIRSRRSQQLLAEYL